MKKILFAIICTFVHFFCFGKEECSSINGQKIPLLALGVGIFDITRTHPTAQYQFEYRFQDIGINFRPLVGITWTQRGSAFIYGSMSYDIFLNRKIILTPSFGPGVYFKGGGKNLHFPLEFRSSIELAYLLQNKSRLGLQFYHISNASIAKKNPGTECLILYFAIPLNSLVLNR